MSLFNRGDKTGDGQQQPQGPQQRSAQPNTAQPQATPQKAESTAQDDGLRPAEPPKPAPIVHPYPTTTNKGASMASVISKALKITGELESTEDIQIDGQIEGDVRGVGVKIGQNATVKGSVYGDEVELAGTIDGKIESKKVVLGSTARMTGDVWYEDIKIESGAYVSGNLKPDLGKSATRSASKPAGSAASVSQLITGNATGTAHN